MNVSFDQADLAEVVDEMSDAERDKLPFGAIKIDDENTVIFYSQHEANASGMGSKGQVGRNFFADVAPCLATNDYLGRIEKARQSGNVDIRMGWIGDYLDDDAELHVRIQSAPDGGLWIFNLRETDSGQQ
jgi:photoactive yellow protein